VLVLHSTASAAAAAAAAAAAVVFRGQPTVVMTHAKRRVDLHKLPSVAPSGPIRVA